METVEPHSPSMVLAVKLQAVNKENQQQIQASFARLARKKPFVALGLVVVLLIALACGWIGSTSPGSNASPSSPASVDSSASSSAESALNEPLEQAQVVRVVDGDTIKAKLSNGKQHTVRFVGIDTPESVAQDESRNCEEGRITADYTKSLLLPGQTIWLQRDVSDADQYGRLLRYVWLERPSDPANESEIASSMLNAILVKDGYAQVKRYPPDTTLNSLFKRWGDEAIAEGKGVTRKWA